MPPPRGRPENNERSLAEYAGNTHPGVIDGPGGTPATSFWRNALAALPPGIQWRYAADFEAAERYERRLDFAMALWSAATRALARRFAKGLRKSAGILEMTARRVAPTR
jgi:hypothetical protein